LKEEFGRRLRLGVVGGGPESWIGYMHRGAAEYDQIFEVVAGVFSSDPTRSAEKGRQLGITRTYRDVDAMCAQEKQRDDGIDAVAIMTPNDMHYPQTTIALEAGLDVICDKPISETLAEAQDLQQRIETGNRVYCITHAYGAYPMTRHARALVHDGTIGAVRFVQVEYIQSGLATKLEDGPKNNRLNWVLDPKRSGLLLVMSAIGCHVHTLMCGVIGSKVAAVSADAASLIPGRQVIDYTSANLRFANGARGQFIVTQAAAGGENDIRLRVVGDKGLIEWNHRDASYLRLAMQGEPARVIGRGDPFLDAGITALGRTPRGHPEGLREAFANLYREFADDIILRNLGRARSTMPYPRIEDGVHTMAFIEACAASSHDDARWTTVVV
jgi:predicted dehydrogenase